MKKQNNLLIYGSLLIFLSSCSNMFPGADKTFVEIGKGALLEPESFVAEKYGEIDRTVAMGPQINVDLDRGIEIQNNERREINKEERKNYIDVSNTQGNIFPITVNFENISIQDMAVMFSEITGKNILIGDEVEGKVTAKLIDVPWDKALDSILKIKQLAKHVDEEANIIRIHKQDVLVAQEEFDVQRIEDLQKLRDAERSMEPIYTEIFRLYYTKASEVKSEIESVMGASTEGGEAESSSKVHITIDSRLNSMIVKATKSELDLVSRIIKEVDVRTEQILIEAFIVEATDTFSKELGAKFGLDTPNIKHVFGAGGDKYTTAVAGVAGSQSDTAGVLTLGDNTGLVSNTGVTGALGGIGFILGTSASNLKLELSASEKDGVTNGISSP